MKRAARRRRRRRTRAPDRRRTGCAASGRAVGRSVPRTRHAGVRARSRYDVWLTSPQRHASCSRRSAASAVTRMVERQAAGVGRGSPTGRPRRRSDEIVVAQPNAGDRRARDQRDLVGRIVDRGQDSDQVADLGTWRRQRRLSCGTGSRRRRARPRESGSPCVRAAGSRCRPSGGPPSVGGHAVDDLPRLVARTVGPGRRRPRPRRRAPASTLPSSWPAAR